MIHTNIEASINDKCLKNSLYFIYVYCLSNWDDVKWDFVLGCNKGLLIMELYYEQE